MKHSLELRATQSLRITPQLAQSLRLLQLSAIEFEQEIAQAAESNPFLEQPEEEPPTDGQDPAQFENSTRAEDPAVSLSDLAGAASHATTRNSSGTDGDDADFGSYTAAAVGLHDHLLQQVRASRLSERDQLFAGVVVEALDDDGYLRQSLAEVRAVIPAEVEADEEDLMVGLRFVQSLDPVGVGARSPAECLRLQLERVPEDRPGRSLALRIVERHLDLLAAHDTLQLTRTLGCDEDALREANMLILQLDPRPGLRFTPNDARYVVADVIVRKVAGRWTATINPQVLPRIRVNEMYVNILRSSRTGSAAPLARQLQEARWLVRNVQQRFQTIQRVAQAIVDRQSRFLDYGDVAMKPLLQREIARELGVHESTVSRVANAKYMATPRGLIEFKRFFGGQLVADGGHGHSGTAIRALIRHIIANEDARCPLSDIKLMRKLGERGVRIARRTVTKYRDALQIPPVEARRLAAPCAGGERARRARRPPGNAGVSSRS